jgi:hypothetical protein
MASQDDEFEDEGSVSTKRLSKKKHYPFGTPSHLSHPYSQFAHLSGERDTKK